MSFDPSSEAAAKEQTTIFGSWYARAVWILGRPFSVKEDAMRKLIFATATSVENKIPQIFVSIGRFYPRKALQLDDK